MSDVNNIVTATEAAANALTMEQLQQMAKDATKPVQEAPKPKRREIPLSMLKWNPNNDRFMPGTVVAGMAMPNTLNIPALAMQIATGDEIAPPGKLKTPMVVVAVYGTEVDEKGKKKVLYWKVLQGNRRYFALESIVNDPLMDPVTKANASKVDCWAYDELSPEWESHLVHDKTSQGLNESELLRECWTHVRNGLSNPEIYLRMYVNLAEIMDDGRAKLALINAEKDFRKRKEILTSWLNGTIGRIWIGSYQCGERCMRALMNKLLIKDGLASADPEKNPNQPEFKFSQGRFNELNDLIKKEGKAWNRVTGSEAYNKLIDKYVEEDKLGRKAKQEKEMDSNGNKLKKRGLEEISAQRQANNAATVDAILEWAAGGQPNNLADSISVINVWEAAAKTLISVEKDLTGDLKEYARVLRTGSAEEVTAWIKSRVPVKQVTTEVEMEAE